MGTPNREPQEYSRNIKEYKGPGRYIPRIFLLYSWGSLPGVPIKSPFMRCRNSVLLHMDLWFWNLDLHGFGFSLGRSPTQ